MAFSSFVMSNPELDFIDLMVGRFAVEGTRVLDVIVYANRTLNTHDWQAVDYRLIRHADRFELQLQRPENAHRFRIDVLHDGLEGLEMLTAKVEPLDNDALLAFLRTRSIAFVGCARQCADAIETSMRKLDSLGHLFGRHELLVFENDSTDDTAERLRALATELPIRLIQAPGLGRQLTQRTARLAYGRNTLLEAALASGADYICVADLDGVVTDESPTLNAFADAFRRDRCWDAVFPVNAGMYYDIWALRHPVLCPNDFMVKGASFDASLGDALETHYAATAVQADLRTLKGWLPVDSAFGGMGVYKRQALTDVRYVGLHKGRQICEHVPLHEQMRRQGKRLYISPAFVLPTHAQDEQVTHGL